MSRSHLGSGKRSPAKSQRLNGIAAADSRCRAEAQSPSGELFALELHNRDSVLTPLVSARQRTAGNRNCHAFEARCERHDSARKQYLLLQDVELGAEAAEQLRKQVP